MSAGGGFFRRSLAAIAARHHVVLVVEPVAGRTSRPERLAGALRDAARRLLRRRGEHARLAAERGITHCAATSRGDAGLVRHLRRLQPDLICIAGYPWILPPEVYRIPRLGAINLHPSLLPRHRGRMPMYWVYVQDDRETGVTVHWVAEGPDAGDIIAQQRLPLARGESIVSLYERSAESGAALLAGALDAIEAGTATRTPQDERLATHERTVRPGTSVVMVNEWDVERVWHVLSGLFPMFREPLAGKDGAPIRYRGVTGFDRLEDPGPPGSITETPEGWALSCRGGVVRLSRDPVVS